MSGYLTSTWSIDSFYFAIHVYCNESAQRVEQGATHVVAMRVQERQVHNVDERRLVLHRGLDLWPLDYLFGFARGVVEGGHHLAMVGSFHHE